MILKLTKEKGLYKYAKSMKAYLKSSLNFVFPLINAIRLKFVGTLIVYMLIGQLADKTDYNPLFLFISLLAD